MKIVHSLIHQYCRIVSHFLTTLIIHTRNPLLHFYLTPYLKQDSNWLQVLSERQVNMDLVVWLGNEKEVVQDIRPGTPKLKSLVTGDPPPPHLTPFTSSHSWHRVYTLENRAEMRWRSEVKDSNSRRMPRKNDRSCGHSNR